MSERTELRDGRYVLLRTLGEGGQGETFEAVDKRDGRLVAVKRFRVGSAKAWKDVELAEREATTLASLDHPLLPHYVEHFEEEGALVLVMELIEGRSLAVLRREGMAFGVAEVERLLEDASKALVYLHGRAPPVVHRDLKPANVVRRKDGSFAFVDFGAVRDRLKPAGGSTVVGTFGYMAPEQFQGRASAASDVYGIGATALAMLTGSEPEDLPHKGLAIDVANAVPKSTPAWLVRTLEAMLAPDPDRRASSIDDALAQGRSRRAREAKSEPPPPRKSETRSKQERKERRAEKRAEKKSRRRRKRAEGHAPFFLARFFAWFVKVFFGVQPKDAGDTEVPRVRVAPPGDILRRVRSVTPEQAQEDAIRAADLDDAAAEAWADERATREAEEWEPPEAWREAEEQKKKKAKR